MQGPQPVFPTAPQGLQVQIPDGGMPPTGFTEGGENASSPGQMKSPLSKVKDKAKKLRDKIKKVKSPTTPTSQDFGENKQDIPNEGGNAGFALHPPQRPRDYAGEGPITRRGEEEDQLPGSEDQSKYGELGPLEAVSKSGDGTEGFEHAGSPAVPTGSPGGRPQDNSPISPLKNDGPPGTLQAAPTEYHYLPEDDQISSGLLRDASPGASKLGTGDAKDLPQSYSPNISPYESRGRAPDADFTFEQGKASPSHNPQTGIAATSSQENLPSIKLHRNVDSPRSSSQTQISSPGPVSPSERDVNVPYPSDIVKPNPEFGRSYSPMRKKIAVINEEVPEEARTDAGLSLSGYSSPHMSLEKSVPEHAPLTFDTDESDLKTVPSFGAEGKASKVAAPDGETEHSQHRGYPSTAGEDDDFLGKDVESKGKWAADNYSKPQDAETGSVIQARGQEESGKDSADGSEISGSKEGVPPFDLSSKQPKETANSDAEGSMNPPDQKDLLKQPKEIEDEYFDPNSTADSHFQEGFDLGSEENDKQLTDEMFADSTIGKLSEITGAVASKLGLVSTAPPTEAASREDGDESGNIPSSSTGSEHAAAYGSENSLSQKLGKERKPGDSPVSREHDSKTTEQQLPTSSRDGAVFSASSDLASSEPENTGGENFHNNVPESPPQTGGTLQSLKNAFASKLGYGTPTQEPPAEDLPRDASVDGSQTASPREHKQVTPLEVQPPVSAQDEEPEAKNSPSSHSPGSSYAQKLFSTAAAAKDYLWSPKGNTGKQNPVEDDLSKMNTPEVDSPASVV